MLYETNRNADQRRRLPGTERDDARHRKGVCNALDEVELYGFEEGYKGLIYGNYRMLTPRDFSGILTKGGTILGSSRQPFKMMRVPDENGLDKVEAMKQTYHKLRLTAL